MGEHLLVGWFKSRGTQSRCLRCAGNGTQRRQFPKSAGLKPTALASCPHPYQHMNSTHFLNQTLTIKIDRPLGSTHPTHGFIYPLNYGYVPDTIAPDGEELDAYLLGVFEPVKHFTGKCIAVIHRLDDDDDKLILVPQNKQYTDEQIRALTEFQERFFTSLIYRSSNKHAP